jgi:regulatory protein
VDPADEEAAARDLVARRLRAMDGLERHVRMRRLVAMLGRKSYPMDLAVRVVSESLGPADDGDSLGDDGRHPLG